MTFQFLCASLNMLACLFQKSLRCVHRFAVEMCRGQCDFRWERIHHWYSWVAVFQCCSITYKDFQYIVYMVNRLKPLKASQQMKAQNAASFGIPALDSLCLTVCVWQPVSLGISSFSNSSKQFLKGSIKSWIKRWNCRLVVLIEHMCVIWFLLSFKFILNKQVK